MFYFPTKVSKIYSPSAHQGTSLRQYPIAKYQKPTRGSESGSSERVETAFWERQCWAPTEYHRYWVLAKVDVWTGLPQTEASFFQALRRRAFINRTKPGGPGASWAVGEKQGAGSQGGALHGGADPPRPASQPERASVSRPPPARVPESASSAAPDPGGSAAPLGTDTNSSRRSCPASCLGN